MGLVGAVKGADCQSDVTKSRSWLGSQVDLRGQVVEDANKTEWGKDLIGFNKSTINPSPNT